MILTVTLNPAVDKTYRTGELFCGRVNRMRSVTNMPGGKGINVSRILRQYGRPVTATGFLGGFPGKWIEERLCEQGIRSAFVETGEETRSSMNIIADNGYVTEILEPGPTIREEWLTELLNRYEWLAEEAEAVVLSGSAAPGVPEDIYARLIRIASDKGKKVFLDTSGVLLAEGIRQKPFLIKPNRQELEYVIGHGLKTLEELKEAACLLREGGIELVAVSLGRKGMLLAGEDGCMYAAAPKVKTENTVGCGDSAVASMVMSCMDGLPQEEILRRATAVSAANASTFESGNVPQKLAERLYQEIAVQRLD